MKPALLLGALLLLMGSARAADPTAPPPALRAPAAAASTPAAAAAAPLRLQGLREGQPPSALINGRLLQAGERVQGHTLLRIDAAGVLLRDPDGRTHRLTLLGAATPASSSPLIGRRP